MKINNMRFCSIWTVICLIDMIDETFECVCLSSSTDEEVVHSLRQSTEILEQRGLSEGE